TSLDLISHIFESWVLAQNTYWSVGRGLADARAGANPILRLRIVQEEDGWVTTRGHGGGRPPNATPDRLKTAISLASEAGLL
ncbi:MAG: septum formation inhibitor-activating ATPase, partial [Sphingosinicella sp.]